MEVKLKRDGLTLVGDIIKPDAEKCPILIFFHGIMSSRSNEMNKKIREALLERGIASAQFDFNGHGESDGDFKDMTVYGDMLDAAKILQYVQTLPFVTDIYIGGHSMGGVVASMISGCYRDVVKKLVLLAPAATMKNDAQRGDCFGKPFDPVNVPEFIPQLANDGKIYNLGSLLFRTNRTMPIYETAAQFKGETLIIHGSNDEAVGVSGSEGYAEHMPNAKLIVLEGENHGLDAIDLGVTVKLVADFLTK